MMSQISKQRRTLATLLCSVVLLACWNTVVIAQQDKVYLQQLARYDIEPTAESLKTYLHSLTPSLEQQQAIERLIEQLGNDEWLSRESATRSLMRQTGVNELLKHAISGDDPEIRWRARLVAEHTSRESQSLLFAVLTTIEREKIAGLLEPLLQVSSQAPAEPLRSALRRAVAATISEHDVSKLVTALSSSLAETRALVAASLPAASEEKSIAHLPALLQDDSAQVKFAAARSLANLGQRSSLPTLVQLLDEEDLPLRVEAFRTLRAATGHSLPFVVYDPAEKRAAQVAAWKTWLDGEGRTTTLKFPLRESAIDLGRLLVCDQQNNQLIEYDAQGNEIWKKSTPAQPWGCQGLENGHRLVCSFTEKVIVEYDGAGEEVWRAGGLPGGPTSVQRLDNGNTLVACTESSEVVELDRTGKVAWQAKVEGRPVDARRLEDGRTLVALQNAQKIVEVDQAGKVVWELPGVGNAFCAQRLENGNTLVATVGHTQIREFDRAGKVVWAQGAFQTPYTAQRLPSGLTLVADRKGVHEMDAEGTIVRHIATPRLSRAWRY
jgi:HEAT repeat protein